MVSLSQLQTTFACGAFYKSEYRCRVNLNLYDSLSCDALATQASAGRHLRIVLPPEDDQRILHPIASGVTNSSDASAVSIQLCEDEYPGWLAIPDIEHLEPADEPYIAIALSRAEIQERLPAVISFACAAMNVPNHYLWGGTVGPNYDCSGLMQTAFVRAANVWLPRDAYQQEAFTQPVPLNELQPGDLVFFGSAQKATHVGLYLGEQRYIHSSGQKLGRNGIGIDVLSEEASEVSRAYFQQLRGAGRVVASYQPSGGF